MIYLILALLSSSLIMVNFKIYPRFKIDILQSIVTNYMVAFICGWVNLNFVQPEILMDRDWFPLSIASGAVLIFGFFAFAISAAKVGISITSVSGKMSVVIPVILGFIVFGENTGILKTMGILLAIPAFFFIFKKNENIEIKGLTLIFPLLLFLGNGMNDSLLKVAEYFYVHNNNDSVEYLTSAFGVSFILGLIILVAITIYKKKKIQLKNIGAGIFLGLINWFSTLFFLQGLSVLDVSVFVPIFSIGVVLLSTLVGVVFFREKLGKWNILGLILALISILLIALNYD